MHVLEYNRSRIKHTCDRDVFIIIIVVIYYIFSISVREVCIQLLLVVADISIAWLLENLALHVPGMHLSKHIISCFIGKVMRPLFR